MTIWRPMNVGDLTIVKTIADVVHPNHPEDAVVLQGRMAAYAQGCHVLHHEDTVVGYALSHPWPYRQVLALNARIREIPSNADNYFLHDLAILPSCRQAGAGGQLVRILADHAAKLGFGTMSLVAVDNSMLFWRKFGFEDRTHPTVQAGLSTYGAAARYMVREFRTG